MSKLIGILLLTAAALAAQNRIVSTSPAITETLFALGLGPRVVGVSTYCHFPPEATKLPKIGTYLQPSIEAILRLKPDMVIMERLAPQAIEQLRRVGIRVQQVNTGDVATNLHMIEEIAQLANVPAMGQTVKSKVNAALQAVQNAAKGRPKRKVVFIVGRTPGRLEGMVAVGKGSYLNELIAMAGGANILADSAITYPRISLEALVRLQPDVIIDMGDMAETIGVTDEHKRSVVSLWRGRQDIKARVYAVASDIYVVPGPRMAEAARELESLINGGPPSK